MEPEIGQSIVPGDEQAMDTTSTVIHPTAEVSPQATIGQGTKIWHQAQVRERARIGDNCIVGKGVYIDVGVSIGANSKLQNGVHVYHGTTIEDGVFLGPGVILTNDRLPRAVNPDGSLKTDADWQVSPVYVKRGASLGAGSIVLPGVTIGEFAMVGAGTIVTQDVPSHGLVYGNPGRLHGYVCRCGQVLTADVSSQRKGESGVWLCPTCYDRYQL
jgi:UDP-2-acetamido-3-amino-2,3-dideoxy-glucuronate N-acetyltransferase